MRRIVVAALAVCCLSILGSAEAQARPTVASWYGPGFAGNLTANGERYVPSQATAAHKSLPFGTPVTVCYRDCIGVTVNDRGPYANGAEFDLSRGSAEAIGLIHPGVATVRVTVHRSSAGGRSNAGGAGGAAGGPGGSKYRVRNGDTLGVISRRLGVGAGKLASANGIADPDVIRAGKVLSY